MNSLTPRSILVVDDDPGSRLYLAEALQVLGYDATQASNAGEALQVLGERPPDLVCTDLRMPGLDGLEFIALAHALAPTLPLILVTANGGADGAAEARRLGAVDLLRKPVSLSALAAALQRVAWPPAPRADGREGAGAGLDATLLHKATQLSVLTQFGSALGGVAARIGGAAPSPEGPPPAAAHVLPAGADVPALVDRSLDFVLRALPGTGAVLALTGEGEVRAIAARGEEAGAIPLEAVSHRLRNEGGGQPWHGVLDSRPLVAALLAGEGRDFGFVCAARDPGAPPFTWADGELLAAFAAQTAVTIQNAVLRRQLERAFQETVTSLVVTLEARHKYTEGHSLRVADYAPAIAAAMDAPPGLAEQVRTAGLLHDVGKVGVSDAVLDKPGRLTPEEWAAMRLHPVFGWKILLPLGFLAAEALSVRHHHERFDGKGYPDGLAGEAIPMPARIIAVADSFDAMTSPRPYRGALPDAVALAEIERGAGTQYDPAVVQAFMTWHRARFRARPAA